MAEGGDFEVAEIFGRGVGDQSDVARHIRTRKHCPFRDTPCTKDKKDDPLGICSLSNDVSAAAICPVRYLERDIIFTDAAELAFGAGVEFGVFPEIRILKIDTPEGARERKIGKVDFVIGRVEDGRVTDFAAVEVQASYISGIEMRTLFHHYLAQGNFGTHSIKRRPDFRSSAQKRLIPQLQLKVPVFRRWGKKFFVVTDTQFFGALPEFPRTTPSNSELTWLAYPITKDDHQFSMGPADVIYSAWDDVQNSLREGSPPEPDEIVDELQSNLLGPEATRPRLLET